MKVPIQSTLCVALICVTATVSASGTQLASRDQVTIAIEDIEAQHFMLSDVRRKALIRNEVDLFRSIEDGLNARVYANIVHRVKKYSEGEGRYITNQVERAHLAAALNVHERRIRAAFQPESEITLARAQEAWIADTDRYFTDESVDISQVYFDTQKRTWIETQRRIEAASEKLKRGEPFESVAREFSDDPAARTSDGRLQGVKAAIADGYLRAVLFSKLRPGEVSEPTPARRGVYIVRLDKKTERSKKPFESVKHEIVAALLEADARSARVALLQELEKTPTTVNESEVLKWIPRAEIDVNELIRQIHRERGIGVSEPVKTQ